MQQTVRTTGRTLTQDIDWAETSDITDTVEDLSHRCLAAYAANPYLIKEHVGTERHIAEGGYGRRQIYELVQNGADAALDAGLTEARIAVVLTADALYCANQGDPITRDGVIAILSAHHSAKRGDQIGRFGLGFKSVLAVTDAPHFFSKSGSFRFDPEHARTDIIKITAAERVPSLRIAYPLNPARERQSDPVLAELMEWADTIVRLPISAQGAAWLHDDIRSFPAEFMLFSTHVGSLELDDRVEARTRRVSASRTDDIVELSEDDRTARWRLVETRHQLSEKARETAGELAERESLPFVWAIPLGSTVERGWFWAFFPTEMWTGLRGILNAPWKTNSDRQNLLNETLNHELIERAASLVVDNLSRLARPDDPGAYLDYLPGRAAEAYQWADSLLNSEVYSLSKYGESIPDLDGIFRRPKQVRLHPPGLPVEAVRTFAAAASDRSWAHPSVDTRYRRPRIERIIEGEGKTVRSVSDWLTSLARDELLTDRGAPVRVVAALAEAGITGWEKVPVIPTTTGSTVTCSPDVVFFGEPGMEPPPNAHFVAHEAAADPATRAALEALGIRELDPAGRLEALAAAPDRMRPDTWIQFWELSRAVPDDQVHQIVRQSKLATKVHGLTKAGKWVPLTAVLIPGVVIAVDSDDDAGIALDMEFHQPDHELLSTLGATRCPVVGRDPIAESWFADYRDEQIKLFLKRPELMGRKPQPSHLNFVPTGYAGPCEVLGELSSAAGETFSRMLLETPAACSAWSLRHDTTDYGVMMCANPSLWKMRKSGTIATSIGQREVGDAVGPEMSAMRELFPVADVSLAVARQLRLPATPEEIPQRSWAAHVVHGLQAGPRQVGSVLEMALAVGVRPFAGVSLRDGREQALADVVVCTPADDLSTFVDMGLPHALVSTADVATALCEQWGMRPASTFFTTRLLPIDPSEPVPLIELFPDLAAFGPDVNAIDIVTCDAIALERSSEAGAVTTSVASRLDGNVLYVAEVPGDDAALLEAVLQAKGWELTLGEREALLASRGATNGRQRQRSIKDLATIEEKVVAAVGREALMRRLPKLVIEEIETQHPDGTLTDIDVGRLALAVHGVEVLRHHSDDLTARGLEAPGRWAGGYRARQFVLSLGFPEEFAGFRSEARDPLMHVPGKPSLPPLHPFQVVAAENIRMLLLEGKGRGLLSLPTGAGKTRTAVQAVVEAMRDDELVGPILWVAQTDELCEQAVSAWAENWRAIGPRETLKLARLWSGNEAEDLGDRHHVVIATMSKLEVVMGKPEYDWLSEANVVIVDEAHRATAASYTKLLDWIGMGRGRERIPFIGLTATPYKGTSEAETVRLVNRFDGRRLDGFDDDPYGKLQDMGVLARVEHRLLAGSDIALSANELATLQQTTRLPGNVLERIGEDKTRNQKILESILELPDDFTVLLFAASVNHAELMAGLLSIEGLPSRAISARTDRGARQHYIEQFRRGDLRVLTNYGVLTEGFDAPAVRAVYVTRPTFSPNLYQQMIGRGLRGPKNGGKEVCLIVNVEDNLAAYGESLAFVAFDHLWSND